MCFHYPISIILRHTSFLHYVCYISRCSHYAALHSLIHSESLGGWAQCNRVEVPTAYLCRLSGKYHCLSFTLARSAVGECQLNFIPSIAIPPTTVLAYHPKEPWYPCFNALLLLVPFPKKCSQKYITDHVAKVQGCLWHKKYRYAICHISPHLQVVYDAIFLLLVRSTLW